jgi:hypothetical protein
MKKLMITLAIVLGMGTMAFSQEIESYEETGLFGKGPGLFIKSQENPLFPNHESDEDFDASETPLGSGIAVLMGLGAAYLVGKRRKEE